tara:strand:- start:108 stop:317 length:210 start_codon:yes stop_codon:yes gene_type:complete
VLHFDTTQIATSPFQGILKIKRLSHSEFIKKSGQSFKRIQLSCAAGEDDFLGKNWLRNAEKNFRKIACG